MKWKAFIMHKYYFLILFALNINKIEHYTKQISNQYPAKNYEASYWLIGPRLF